MQSIKNFLVDFKERLCPSTRLEDIREQLRCGFDESLKVKSMEIEDLKTEIVQLKKRRICCYCGLEGEKYHLSVFGQRLWKYTGYPSYFYCTKLACMENYIKQLEDL